MDFIDDFTDFVAERIPTSKDWIEDCAMATLSTVCKKFIILCKDKDMRLNYWCMIIGPSGLTYKSLFLDAYVWPILKFLEDATIKPVLDKDGKPVLDERGKAKTTRKYYMLPKVFTSEGMTMFLNKYTKDGVILSDEFTAFLKGATSKTYMGDAFEYLSGMQSGNVGRKVTIKRGLEHPGEVHISFIGATTPYIFQIMKADFFVQGFGNRLSFSLYKPTKAANYDDYFSKDYKGTLNARIKMWAELLKKIEDCNLKYVTLDLDAEELYINYRTEQETEVLRLLNEENDILKPSYIIRLHEKALKTAGLYCVSRHANTLHEYEVYENDDDKFIEINAADMQRAIDKTNKSYQYYLKIIEEWQTQAHTKTQPMETIEPAIDKILRIIRREGGSILHSDLLIATQIQTDSLQAYTKTLKDRGDITIDERKGKGRKGTYYNIVK